MYALNQGALCMVTAVVVLKQLTVFKFCFNFFSLHYRKKNEQKALNTIGTCSKCTCAWGPQPAAGEKYKARDTKDDQVDTKNQSESRCTIDTSRPNRAKQRNAPMVPVLKE
jgi:hypothetical protein